MTDEQMEESLSALVDGELPHARAERVLDRVLDDVDLRERWRRHHLIRAALSARNSLVVVDDELASRVSAALDAEVVPLRRPTRRLSWSVGLAAAASVATLAVLVVLGLANDPGSGTSVPPLAALNPSAPEAASAAQVRTAGLSTSARVPTQDADSALTRMTWNDTRPAVEARLNGYLLEHSDYLADGVRGMLPYARVVGYDARN